MSVFWPLTQDYLTAAPERGSKHFHLGRDPGLVVAFGANERGWQRLCSSLSHYEVFSERPVMHTRPVAGRESPCDNRTVNNR
jgi:hypothetical protein